MMIAWRIGGDEPLLVLAQAGDYPGARGGVRLLTRPVEPRESGADALWLTTTKASKPRP